MVQFANFGAIASQGCNLPRPHFIRLLYVPLFAADSRLESESLQRSRRGRAAGLWTGAFFRVLKGLSIIRIVQRGAGVHQQRGRGGERG